MQFSRRNLLEAAASFGLLATVGSVPVEKSRTEGVVGAWSLISFDIDEGKGGEKPRFGPNPAGYLIYSADRRMAAVLAGTRRAPLRAPTGGTAGTEAQCNDSVLNFLAYAGRYEIRGDRVFHYVEVSVFTNLIGTTLERQFKISGDTLTIRTLPPEIWGGSNVLVWRRA